MVSPRGEQAKAFRPTRLYLEESITLFTPTSNYSQHPDPSGFINAASRLRASKTRRVSLADINCWLFDLHCDLKRLNRRDVLLKRTMIDHDEWRAAAVDGCEAKHFRAATADPDAGPCITFFGGEQGILVVGLDCPLKAGAGVAG